MNELTSEDPEIMEYLTMAYGGDASKEKSSLHIYANRLGLIKDWTGCKSLKDFNADDKKKARRLWETLMTHMKDNLYSKSTINVTVSALTNYLMLMDINIPNFIRHQKKVTRDMSIATNERKRQKELLIRFMREDFNKIYTTDLSEYHDDPFIQEEVRFMCIHFMNCGMRVSEVVQSLVSDFKLQGGLKHVLIRAKKTKEDYYRAIIEDKYWLFRDKYVRMLNQRYPNRNTNKDWLFPKLNSQFGEEHLSEQSVTKIISGSYIGYNTKGGKKWKPGLAEIVWGKRIWTHIFRGTKTNQLLDNLSLEEVMEWRKDASINTTMCYVSETEVEKKLNKNLKNLITQSIAT